MSSAAGIDTVQIDHPFGLDAIATTDRAIRGRHVRVRVASFATLSPSLSKTPGLPKVRVGGVHVGHLLDVLRGSVALILEQDPVVQVNIGKRHRLAIIIDKLSIEVDSGKVAGGRFNIEILVVDHSRARGHGRGIEHLHLLSSLVAIAIRGEDCGHQEEQEEG